jgi:eukaryotic-like serine/threonine-protein kinase
MGDVWAARDDQQVRVAIKIVAQEKLNDPTARRLFIEEGKIAMQVRSPYVVETLGMGEHDNVQYCAMEYVHGVTLQDLIDAARESQRPISPSVAARIAHDLGLALETAHSKGVIHRDVSPQNVMVSIEGRVRLMDFGIAKVKERMRQTTTDVVRGKAHYLAPEQARSEPFDARADLWSVGVVLYQVLSGEHPAGDMNDLQVLAWLLGNEPVRAVYHPSSTLDPSLALVTKWLLQRSPERRLGSATELVARVARSPMASEPELAQTVQDLCGQKLQHVENRIRAVETRWRNSGHRRSAVLVALGIATVAMSAGAWGLRNRAPLRAEVVGVAPHDVASSSSSEPVALLPSLSVAVLPSAAETAAISTATTKALKPFAPQKATHPKSSHLPPAGLIETR